MTLPERSSLWPVRVVGDPRWAGLTLRRGDQRSLRLPINALWNLRNDARVADWLYRLVRQFRPRRAVETGVYFGKSTVAILAALRRNGVGRLISIDLPESPEEAPSRTPKRIGKLVPASLRDRWELRLGDAKELLPAALSGGVDFFLHDSDHTYAHMTFEYETAWNALPVGGVLASDDTQWSTAWDEFLLRHQGTYHVLPDGPYHILPDGPGSHRAIRRTGVGP